MSQDLCDATKAMKSCLNAALPPVMVSHSSDPAHTLYKYRSDYLKKRASIATPRITMDDDMARPPIERSPRRSLGAVWRVSSSSPARQLGVWLGRRPRSFTSAEDQPLTPHLAVRKLVPPPPPSPDPSHGSSSPPDSPSPMDHTCKGVSSSPSAGSLLVSPAVPSIPPLTLGHHRPTRLVITGRTRTRPRRLSHTPTVTRLCNLTVTRLQVSTPLASDLNCVILAVKMQSSKRTLRSNEIPLPNTGILDTELQLTFSLQYPHFLKREGNTLQIMLQRRKKYKNRTFLGFKTLAVGVINMAKVLQRPVDRELVLHSEGKETAAMAKVTMEGVSSQPVDTEESRDRHTAFITDNPALAPLLVLLSRGAGQGGAVPSTLPPYRLCTLPRSLPPIPRATCADRSIDLVEDSEEEEEFSSQDEGSDSDENDRRHHLRPTTRSKSLPPNARVTSYQRNFKQRFIALLKRFKVPEDIRGLDQDQDGDPSAGVVGDPELEELFHELEESMSDSGPEVDTISITSTPKPSLQPYFSSSRSLLNEGLNVPEKLGADRMSDESSKRADSDHMETWTDPEHSDPQIFASSPPREDRNKSNKTTKLFTRDRSNLSLKEKKSSSSVSTPRQEKVTIERTNSLINCDSSPRKVLMEQLAKVLPMEDSHLPDHVVLVNTAESHGSLLAGHLMGHRVITTMMPADVRATVGHLVTKLQKFCNSNSKSPGPMKVVIVGSDTYVNCVLRPYVEMFSSMPPDYQNHIRFLIIPLAAGSNCLAKYLSSVDSTYAASFVSESWREAVERWEKPDVQEGVNRIHHYLSQAQHTLHLPIAEAMLNYKEKSDDESTQAFVPFITDVRLGPNELGSTSVDLDDQASPPSALMIPGSPPSAVAPVSSLNIEKSRENITPPSSPNINIAHINNRTQYESGNSQEPLDLQVDYWLVRSNKEDREKEKDKARVDGGKYTIKTTFRTLQVTRLANQGVVPPQDPNAVTQHLGFSFSTKEKKQRIMRLGKKKEKERDTESKREVEGVCRLLASTRNQPFKVNIDSVEWINVKFFQLSSQWQTQIKTFPISIFTPPDSNL